MSETVRLYDFARDKIVSATSESIAHLDALPNEYFMPISMNSAEFATWRDAFRTSR